MDETAEKLSTVWERTLSDLKSRVSEQTFNAWFFPLQPLSLTESSITLGVPNEFSRDWVSERYLPLIKTSVSTSAGKDIAVSLSVMDAQEIGEEKKNP